MIRNKILGLWLLCSLTWLLTACISDNDSDPSTPEVEVGNTLPDRGVYSRFANSRIPRIYISDGDLRVRYIHTDFRMPGLETLEKELGSLE
ncbi:MAG: hypothetical protein IJS97_00675 [Prevotella sp.]|nr:hypothetical protein [Prevotella sp.]